MPVMGADPPTACAEVKDRMMSARDSLTDLEQRDAFLGRHIGVRDDDLPEMLATVGVDSLDALIDAAVPAGIRSGAPLALGPPTPEAAALDRLREIAGRNRVLTSLIGMGYANTVTPAVIRRNVLQNPGWYTAYTPYQAEISQGRLEALLNFQTMVADLTGTELANASLLDEATAAAEAMAMCHRISRGKGETFVVDADCHPQTIDVVRTRAEPLGIKVVVGDPRHDELDGDVYGVLLQQPGSSGRLHDDRALIERCHEAGVLVAVAVDLLASVLVTPPGRMGADVVVGSAQRFGVPLGFGGPHAGFLATAERHVRSVPGRIVGVSVDRAGRPAARMALQTREQHIRRERATSNICTAQVLLAVMAGFYGVYHGPEGLRTIAERVHRMTAILAAGLREGGVEVVNDRFFDTLTVGVPGEAAAVAARARDAGYNLREVDADTLGISLDETTTRDDLQAVWAVFGVAGDPEALDATAPDGIPSELRRTDEILTDEVFHRYRSETEMMRYLRELQGKDIALDRSMIPLGSCTMKLNAASEMEPITWPEFAEIHPFVPADQAAGYHELIDELEGMLAEITGYDAVSMQPNAGSQGEFTGLLAIRRYHEARGDGQRNICLIPQSAHGTNAASAVMAGMKVVVVDTDDHGNIDVDRLRELAEQHATTLAALMVTYPSTHGVFEPAIEEICAIIHDHGGQVYLDGANLNAMMGVARPGRFGADVSHLNLHKTFSIPHGGGGPGVGPVGVRAHLAPYLPNHPVVDGAGPDTGPGAVSAAPWGSAGILPISWTYITMMGAEGLLASTRAAVLNANYVAARLADSYPVLYTGPKGFVAHECIIDLRGIQEETGITNEDVAKRLMDYGFHAPTMSFPVAGTLMIEPTESESKAELDRFCDAMIAIRAEIAKVASGDWDAEDNPLRNAPHPAADLLTGEWSHPYAREEAAYPASWTRTDKYWPPVSRIDNAHGDRNLVCSCAPIDAYREGEPVEV